MNKVIAKLLTEWVERGVPDDLVSRDFVFDEELLCGKVRKILTFTGFRRVGKTYLMFQAIKELAQRDTGKSAVFYINFEDERIPLRTETLTELLPTVKEMYGEREKTFLFLDEIQNIPKWSKWTRRVYDSERSLHLFLGGSSSKLSAGELPTELRGRCLSFEIFPLSLKEIDFRTVEYSDTGKAILLRNLGEYLTFGGLPEVVLLSDEKKKVMVLQEYYRTVVKKDIAEIYGIRNISLLSDFIKLLLNSTLISISSCHKTLQSSGYKISKNTLANYLKYAEETYLAFTLSIFSKKVKDQTLYPKKIYFIDNGLITALSLKFSENKGRLLENLVAVELKKRHSGNPSAELYYWRSRQEGEVDFVLKEGLEVKQLIQACYAFENEQTKERETSALIKASEELECENLLVITWDYEGEEKIRGKKIRYQPLWKWLVSGSDPNEPY